MKYIDVLDVLEKEIQTAKCIHSGSGVGDVLEEGLHAVHGKF